MAMNDKQAIGNKIGKPTPYIMVTKTMFISFEYLKSIWNVGPVYRLIY